jgi:hypothetical protein
MVSIESSMLIAVLIPPGNIGLKIAYVNIVEDLLKG